MSKGYAFLVHLQCHHLGTHTVAPPSKDPAIQRLPPLEELPTFGKCINLSLSTKTTPLQGPFSVLPEVLIIEGDHCTAQILTSTISFYNTHYHAQGAALLGSLVMGSVNKSSKSMNTKVVSDLASISAPASSKAKTALLWPASDAKCKGLLVSSSSSLMTCLFLWTSSLTTLQNAPHTVQTKFPMQLKMPAVRISSCPGRTWSCHVWQQDAEGFVPLRSLRPCRHLHLAMPTGKVKLPVTLWGMVLTRYRLV